MIKRANFLNIVALFFLLVFINFVLFPHVSFAQVSAWQKGASVIPASTSDFSSDSFKSSLRNLSGIHTNYVTFIIPYYQSNLTSIDLGPGWNTPTDQSLISGIDYAHTLGLKVMIKIHAESNTGEWRIHINPSDRDGWFRNYGNILNHYADIAAQHGVETYCIGAELRDTSSPNANSDNTAKWINLIDQVRQRYSGKLTYSAQHTTPNEEDEIQFWDHLDYIGLSAYFPLDTSNNNPTVDSLKASWDQWNNSIISPLYKRWHKPILFTEIGYKSVSGAHYEPAAYWRNGDSDETEQARDYEALFSFWNDKSYMMGISIWEWESNPNAGGSGSTSYTPQNKQAQNTISNWFGNNSGFDSAAPTATPSQPDSNSSPSVSASSYTMSASISPSNPSPNQNIDVSAQIKPDSQAQNIIVDIEIYKDGTTKTFQKFFENQNISANTSQTYKVGSSINTEGRYRVKIGVFNNDWSNNYYWNDNVLTFDVGASGSSSSPNPLPTQIPAVQPTNIPTSTSLDIWWPTNNVSISGTQPLKAMLTDISLQNYHLYWQVDGGQLNEMQDNQTDYPHKESGVDVNNWNWKGSGLYTINFIAKDNSGNTIKESSVNVTVYH